MPMVLVNAAKFRVVTYLNQLHHQKKHDFESTTKKRLAIHDVCHWARDAEKELHHCDTTFHP